MELNIESEDIWLRVETARIKVEAKPAAMCVFHMTQLEATISYYHISMERGGLRALVPARFR